MVNRLDLVAWQLKLQCPGLEVGNPSIISVTIIVASVVKNPRLCRAGLSWLRSVAIFSCVIALSCLSFHSACTGCSTCVRPYAHHARHLNHDRYMLCVTACRLGCYLLRICGFSDADEGLPA